MSKLSRILLVEDDQNLGFLLSELLHEEGYQVQLCEDGKRGWKALENGRFDLCILDVMMPQMDGFQLAEKIKESRPKLPFLFITAKTHKVDKLKGFSIGAEDYIMKPFDDEELLCRIQVILRRQNTSKSARAQQFQLGAFHFDYDLQSLTHGDTICRLTEKENEVLYQLCLHKNQILKREEAVEAIYGKKDYFLGRSFDVFISKIRKRFKDEPAIRIENVFKVGFIFHVEEERV